MRTPVLAIALSLLIGPFAHAQDGRDFTGRWILNSASPPSAEVPRALSVRQSLVTTNVRGEPMRPAFKDITVVREVKGSTRTETYQIGMVGGVIGDLGAGGRHHAVTWDEDVLVFESGSYTGQTPESGTWTERRETWSLDSDDRLHVVITTRSPNDAHRTVALVYRRR